MLWLLLENKSMYYVLGHWGGAQPARFVCNFRVFGLHWFSFWDTMTTLQSDENLAEDNENAFKGECRSESDEELLSPAGAAADLVKLFARYRNNPGFKGQIMLNPAREREVILWLLAPKEDRLRFHKLAEWLLQDAQQLRVLIFNVLWSIRDCECLSHNLHELFKPTVRQRDERDEKIGFSFFSRSKPSRGSHSSTRWYT